MLLQLLGSGIFVGCAAFTFYYAKKSRYQHDKQGNFFKNEVLIGVTFILTAILYPFFFIDTGISPATEETMYLLTLLVFTGEIGLFGINILMEREKCLRNPQLLVDRDYERIKTEYRSTSHYNVKKDFKRKMLHLLAVIVIVMAFEMSRILETFNALPFGMTSIAFYKWLTITIGLAFVIMFVIGDGVRLTKNAYLPPWAVKWFTSSLKEEELVTFIASAPLVLGFVPFIFAPYQLFISVALITSLGDAAASLVGKTFGKHHLSPTNKKTFEGLFAGAFATFTIVTLAMGLYPSITLTTLFSMAAVAASLFIVVDVTTHKLSDNIINSLACGSGMVLIFLFMI